MSMKNIVLIVFLLFSFYCSAQDKLLFGKWKIVSVSGDGYYFNSEKDSVFLSDVFKERLHNDSKIINDAKNLIRKTYLNALYFYDEFGNHSEVSDKRKEKYKYSVDIKKSNIQYKDFENNTLMFEVPYKIENNNLHLTVEQKYGNANLVLKRE